MSKRPWMPLYVADYMAKTAHLTVAEHGAYMLLIMNYWHNGGLPDDENKIARIARMSAKQWSASKETLKAFFGNNWKHSRIDQEIAQAIEISRKRSAIARQKHNKRPPIADTLHTSHSVPKGTDAGASDDPRLILFDEGVSTLEAFGVKSSRVRAIIGRWLKDAGDDDVKVLAAIRRAREHRIVDPVPWITATLGQKGAQNVSRPNEFRTAVDQAVARLTGNDGSGGAR